MQSVKEEKLLIHGKGKELKWVWEKSKRMRRIKIEMEGEH